MGLLVQIPTKKGARCMLYVVLARKKGYLFERFIMYIQVGARVR